MTSRYIADGVWSIYLTPENGKRVLDGEDTSVVRARELYALAVADAPASTQVELVTPSGRVARSAAGTKPELSEAYDVAYGSGREVTPIADVARGLSAAGWNIRQNGVGLWCVHEDTQNLFGQPCIEMDYTGEPTGLIAAVDQLDQELSGLECVGWTAEARYGPNTGTCLLVVWTVVIIA